MIFKIKKLINKMNVNIIEDYIMNPNEKYIRITIKQGFLNDPINYPGTNHFLEHIIGSFFGQYGTLDLLEGLSGVTRSKYLYIKKIIKTDEDVGKYVNSIIQFLLTKSFNLNLLEYEKIMVNNEFSSKLDSVFLFKLFIIFESIKFNTSHSLFGSLKVLDNTILQDYKNSIDLENILITFKNIDKNID